MFVKGVLFSYQRYAKGVSANNGIEKGRGSDLRVEPPHINFPLDPHTGPMTCVLYLPSTMEVSLKKHTHTILIHASLQHYFKIKRAPEKKVV